MRHLIRALFALTLLASWPAAANAAPVVYCGTVKANTIASGAGSGPRVFEFQVSTGPGGSGEQRFSVPDAIALPTVGSYICGQFEQGAPFMQLVTLLREGDAGYVAQVGSLPATATTKTQATLFGTGSASLLLFALACLAGTALLVARSRRILA